MRAALSFSSALLQGKERVMKLKVELQLQLQLQWGKVEADARRWM
tara:strand:- start:168 stop:302 length:135 start_codon:yes stop_codon:yes gene_type:complete